MSVISIVGLQWGDEGKGKIVDFLAEQSDIVVRFQGGHNAGHTIVVDGVEYKLSILPSGIIRDDKISVIGNGVVIDPFHFKKEVEKLKAQGISISPKNLMIADNSILILPIHQQLDKLQEVAKKDSKIGTTGRGIGPAYADKISRRAIRTGDLKYPELVIERLDEIYKYYEPILKAHNLPTSTDDIKKDLIEIGKYILPYVKPVWRELKSFSDNNKNILFEGAQGVMLDIDHGTYPFVTSSNTISNQALIGSGFGKAKVSKNIGVVKAYTTRVGEGPFPSELHDETGDFLQTKGHEFGTVTGRTRRTGWLDAVQLRQMINVSGINSLALTKIDVLTGLKNIKIAVKYELKGEEIDFFPSCHIDQEQIKPIFKTLPGFYDDFTKIKKYEDLSENAQNFINELEILLETNVDLVSISPKREDTFVRKELF